MIPVTSLARLLVLPAAILIAACGTGWADAVELKPYKDRLFGYPGILSSTDDGAAIAVDYRELRDINRRDAVPERRVQAAYVDLGVRRSQQDLVVDGIRHIAVGRTDGARIITIYLHGQGGNRMQGANDFTFGGNFNRIKNLMARNGGLYLTIDLPDFGAGGAAAVSRLIAYYGRTSSDAPVFIACGSMGGILCWRMAGGSQVVERLGGLILLGSDRDERFLASPAFRRRVPVLVAHGSRDSVFPIDRQRAFFDTVRRHAPGYPIRFVRFETGSHGTPIRMTDWRETLNWMLSQR
ncbi:alpha/beta hydrolase [Mesorhizobium xinjiangense]|uniref:alpha/beta hydrolase n=1 Tax=Mesorhizobium xinjiangense TaxID=2678685 RepID=UPI0012EE6C30|nr:alpha/beta hydrolase [Mesorhizobium xinjiangense]